MNFKHYPFALFQIMVFLNGFVITFLKYYKCLIMQNHILFMYEFTNILQRKASNEHRVELTNVSLFMNTMTFPSTGETNTILLM